LCVLIIVDGGDEGGAEEDEELSAEEKNVLVRALHRVLRPFILRRLKSDVAKDLPDKVCSARSYLLICICICILCIVEFWCDT